MSDSSRSKNPQNGLARGLGGLLGSLNSTVGTTLNSMTEGVGSISGSATEGVGNTAKGVTDTLGNTAKSVGGSSGQQQARQRWWESFTDLLVGSDFSVAWVSNRTI
ncbi:hypothetical protein F5Y19DRAFT_479001 [Xylariaceae sp. FL1651]|nr:hypothetical protein F5Y19DRAFT_479001 [Xylariaceae sp. FL1651]